MSVTVSFSTLPSLLMKSQQSDSFAGLTNLVRGNQAQRPHHVTSLRSQLVERVQRALRSTAFRGKTSSRTPCRNQRHQRQDTLLGAFCSNDSVALCTSNATHIISVTRSTACLSRTERIVYSVKTRSSVPSAPPCAGRSSPQLVTSLLLECHTNRHSCRVVDVAGLVNLLRELRHSRHRLCRKR